LCPFGHSGPECVDLESGSPFLIQLNNQHPPNSVKLVTIAGDCCKDGAYRGDEVIRVNSVAIDGATNIIIQGEEVPGLFETFHSALIHPSQAPEVYHKVLSFIKK
jgi:hypothetical protein